MSPSSRRAWVEISNTVDGEWMPRVALLAEGVGRNFRQPVHDALRAEVALLAEGVGRNLAQGRIVRHLKMVALLAEGVGRNQLKQGVFALGLESPSSRRAWVEIDGLQRKVSRRAAVALLAEGVGRNRQ